MFCAINFSKNIFGFADLFCYCLLSSFLLDDSNELYSSFKFHHRSFSVSTNKKKSQIQFSSFKLSISFDSTKFQKPTTNKKWPRTPVPLSPRFPRRLPRRSPRRPPPRRSPRRAVPRRLLPRRPPRRLPPRRLPRSKIKTKTSLKNIQSLF